MRVSSRVQQSEARAAEAARVERETQQRNAAKATSALFGALRESCACEQDFSLPHKWRVRERGEGDGQGGAKDSGKGCRKRIKREHADMDLDADADDHLNESKRPEHPQHPVPPFRRLQQNLYRPPLQRPLFCSEDAPLCTCRPDTGCGLHCQNRLLYMECVPGCCASLGGDEEAAKAAVAGGARNTRGLGGRAERAGGRGGRRDVAEGTEEVCVEGAEGEEEEDGEEGEVQAHTGASSPSTSSSSSSASPAPPLSSVHCANMAMQARRFPVIEAFLTEPLDAGGGGGMGGGGGSGGSSNGDRVSGDRGSGGRAVSPPLSRAGRGKSGFAVKVEVRTEVKSARAGRKGTGTSELGAVLRGTCMGAGINRGMRAGAGTGAGGGVGKGGGAGMVAKASRGFGLRLLEPVAASTVIVEYTGEVITSQEGLRRMGLYSPGEDFYFASIGGGLMLDAKKMGSLARFANHSCDPTCLLQRWVVAGESRIALVSKRPLQGGSELTYNYCYHDDGLESKRMVRQVCHCGAANCAGTIGGKLLIESQETLMGVLVERCRGLS
ncbi:hypothetical protein B484DRAFT_349628, partial [Ochromonadaceae sp. CCMP2298]